MNKHYIREDEDDADDEIDPRMSTVSGWCLLLAMAFIAVMLLWSCVSDAQSWSSTRTTTHDYSCTDADGTVISGHTRIDTAFVACANLSLQDGKTRYVIGGRYRIDAKVAAPTPPAPTTGTVTLSWTPPTHNTDGSALTNLAGYRILYGTSATALTQTVQVASPALATYVIEGLAQGTWYFAVKAYTLAGTESAPSNVASKVIS